MLVYLAGPITGLTFPIANAWRQRVVDSLPGYEFLNPLRFDRDEHREPAFNGMKNIVRRNYHDVQRSDLILACFETCSADNVSIGSVYELAWGYSLRIPVVPGLTSYNYLKEAVDYNLDEAIRIIRILEEDTWSGLREWPAWL